MTLVKFRPARHAKLYDSVLPSHYLRPMRYSSDFGWNPRVDIVEKEKAFELRAELPGIEKKDIELVFNDDVLTLRGEKKSSEDVKEDRYFRSERSYGKFERTFRFRVPVLDDKIEASFKNGVLSVSVPKSPEAEPAKISIK